MPGRSSRAARSAACAVPALAAAVLTGTPARASETKLLGADIGQLRREALELFPRGKPVAEVADGLRALGFQCSPTKIVLANVSAPTIQCDSAGRGFPTTPRIVVVLITRNGALADIAVAGGLDVVQADASNPDGSRTTSPSAGAEPGR